MESPLRLQSTMPPPSFAAVVGGTSDLHPAPSSRVVAHSTSNARRASGGMFAQQAQQHTRNTTSIAATAEQQTQQQQQQQMTPAHRPASVSDAVPAAATPGSGTGKPPRQISPPLHVASPPHINVAAVPSPSSAAAAAAATYGGGATPPASAGRISLPPLPPLADRFSSPAFVPQNSSALAQPPNQRSYSNTNLYTAAGLQGSGGFPVPPSPAHSPMHVWGGPMIHPKPHPTPLFAPAVAQSHPTPLFAPAAQSSPSHNFAPRPSSPQQPSAFSLSGSTPALQMLTNGTVCVCPNDPGAAPCSCSVGVGGQTPLLTGSRPLSQSMSMDGGFLLSRASSHGSSCSAGGQPTAMPTCWSPHHPGPQRRHMRQGSVSSVATTMTMSLSNSSHSNSSTPSYTSLASLGMVSPSSLPTQAAPHSGSHAHSASAGSTGGVTINIFHNPQTQQQVQMQHASAIQLMQAQTAGLGLTAGGTPIPPAQRLPHHAHAHSIFSPTAPGTLEALQRQLSVSPQEFAASRTPPTPTGSPPPPASVSHMSTQGAGMGSVPPAPHTTIRIVSPAGGSETAPTAVSNLPLTASTIRLIRKAVEAVRSLFPSSGDSAVELMKDAPAVPVGTTTVLVAREKTAGVSPRSSLPPSPQVLKAAAPAGSVVAPVSSPVSLPAAAASSSCSCPTAPVVCYCAHNLHRVSSAPEFVIDSVAIAKGYRGVMSPWDCLKGLGQIHNETANVWSHVWACGFMAHQAWRVGSAHPELRMQALAGSGLFGLSALAHLFAPVSAEINASLFRLDRCAISADETAIGICGAMIHFSAPDQAPLRRLVVALNLLLGSLSLRALWNPAALQNKSIKIGVLSAQALVCFFPAWLARRASVQSDPALHAMLGRYALLAGGWAGLGVLLYGSGFPEKLIYRAEERENHRRHDMAAAAAAGVSPVVDTAVCQSCSPSPISASGSAATSSFVSPTSAAASSCVSTSSSSSCCSRPAPSLPSHLSSSPGWRVLHWLTSHVFHSHHIMHWCVWLAVWFAFKGSWAWKINKMRAAAAMAARQTIN